MLPHPPTQKNKETVFPDGKTKKHAHMMRFCANKIIYIIYLTLVLQLIEALGLAPAFASLNS
jgi:hypothetical protein